MTTFIAIPLEDNYLKPSVEIAKQLNNPKARPQADNTVETSRILIDHMFALTVDGLIEQVELKPFAHSIVHQVSTLVQKAIHIMVKKVVGKLDNRELKPLVEYYKAQEIEHQGKIYLGFQIDSRIETLIASCIQHLENGNIDASKKELIIVLEDIIENTLNIFLLEAMGKVRLGLIARKVVDLTHATIDKAVPPALHKIVNHMDHSQLEQLKSFLLQYIFKVDG